MLFGAQISVGIPETDSPTTTARYIGLRWSDESDFQPQHRILSGERITVYYDLVDLVAQLEPGQRVRHECQDWMGNTYVGGWVDYHDETRTSITHHGSPGEGYREPTTPDPQTTTKAGVPSRRGI